ncbi:MAG: AAA family ATPase [Gammaproteobacteria bacterium]|nr:AAA family ATPase [Gammaproteobacteria bacterium]
MYSRHFGLREHPFSLTPNTKFIYQHNSYSIALNTLLIALHSGEGFIKITGEIGTGKTLLCRMLINTLRGRYLVAYIPNPYLEPLTLLTAIADEFGIDYPENVHQHQLLKKLNKFIIDTYAQRRHTIVLCFDEAHAMPIETLDVLRMLSNLETQQRKLIQIVLFGQPELDKRLDQPLIRQLKQRIGFSYELKPLHKVELDSYVMHRLQIAGYQGPSPFTTPALGLLYRASGGTQRLVNILAHKSLMSAYGKGDTRITRMHMKRAIADTECAIHKERPPRYRFLIIASVITTSLLLLATGSALIGG